MTGRRAGPRPLLANCCPRPRRFVAGTLVLVKDRDTATGSKRALLIAAGCVSATFFASFFDSLSVRQRRRCLVPGCDRSGRTVAPGNKGGRARGWGWLHIPATTLVRYSTSVRTPRSCSSSRLIPPKSFSGVVSSGSSQGTHLPSVPRRTHRPKLIRQRHHQPHLSTHPTRMSSTSRHLQLIRHGCPQLIFRRRIQDIFNSFHKDVLNSSSARLPKAYSQDDLRMSYRDVSRVRPSDAYSGHLFISRTTSLGRPTVISLG